MHTAPCYVQNSIKNIRPPHVPKGRGRLVCITHTVYPRSITLELMSVLKRKWHSSVPQMTVTEVENTEYYYLPLLIEFNVVVTDRP